MLVTITRPVWLGANGSCAAGKTVELPEGLARELIALHKAVSCAAVVHAPAITETTAAPAPVAAEVPTKRTRARK